jgi:hypothetical protein
MPRRAFLRRGFPNGFSRGIPCSAYTVQYPIPASATVTYTVRADSEKRAGEYRENGAGVEREALQPDSNNAYDATNTP